MSLHGYNSRLARHVLFFGLPLVVGLACHAAFNLVDTFLVGQMGLTEGAQAISVTGLCDPITTFQTILFNGPIAGAGVLLARKVGANDTEGLRKVALQAAGFVIAMSIAMAIPGYLFAEQIALGMGAARGWQLEQSREYLEVMLAGGITAGMFLYLTTVERSIGNTGTFLLFFMLSNVLNALLGLLLIYGPGPYPGWYPAFLQEIVRELGIPRMGVVGSAWATVGARALATLGVLAIGLKRGVLRGSIAWLIPKGVNVIALIKIGLWNNGQIAARGIGGGILIRTLQEAGGQRPEVLGGVFVGLKMELLLVLLAFGWGAAAQTLVATSLGSGKPERARMEERLTMLYATLMGAALTVPAFVFADDFARLFNDDPQLIEWSATYLKLMAPAFVFVPLNIVISQAMVARNQLRLPVIVDSVLLLGVLSPTLIVLALAGASVQTLIVVNMVANIVLTAVYLYVRQRLARPVAAPARNG